MAINKTIGFIGAGNMASALIESIIKAGLVSPENIIASDRNKEKLEKLKKNINIAITQSNKEVAQNSDILFLCVKPKDFDGLLEEIKDIAKNKLIVSIAAGIKLKKIESKLDSRVIRVMPNTPCIVGEMAAGFSLGKKSTKKDAEIIKNILTSAGKAFLLKEDMLDVVTALSGSGPAFFAFFIDEFAKAAIKNGLDKDIAFQLAAQTCLGTGKLLLEKNIKPDELIKMVASKGGTTEAGLKVLKKSTKLLEKTFNAALKKSKGLGK